MKDKRRIALITTWFPPQQSVATNRMLSFVEFLREDFEIEIFTLDTKEGSTTWKENVIVHYSLSSKLFELLKSKPTSGKFIHFVKTAISVLLSKIIKKPLNGWRRRTLKKLVARNKVASFDAIISSFSPEEAHLVVVDFLKNTGSKAPWIADMRDEMSANPYLSAAQKGALQEVESLVDKYASAITAVSSPIIEDFKKICPRVKQFTEIRNGFNHSFQRDLSETVQKDLFKIGYFGSFYGTRKPDYLFKALIQVKREEPNFNYSVEIVGAHPNFHIPNEIADFVELKPGLKYEDGIKAMAKMDLNVVMHPASKQKGIFTGKLFDYISVQKPVLALVDTTDVAAELVSSFNCGYNAEFDDVEMIKNMVLEAFSDWQSDNIRFASNENKDSLHRSFQVAKMKELLNKLIVQ